MVEKSNGLRAAGVWFVAAGVLALVRAGLELTEPAYYDPQTLIDYAAATLTSVAWVVAAVALFLWWRATPIKRGAFLLLIAATGIAISGVGNFVEDVLDIGWGEFLFSYGGMVSAISLLIGGIILLTVRGAYRWTGLFLVAFIAGGIFPDSGGQFVSGASLVGLGSWLHRISASVDTGR